MADSVTRIDKAGRVIIPKVIRERMGLVQDTTLLISHASKDIVVLKKLDVKELAQNLQRELKGIDIEGISKRVEKRANEQARKRYKAIRH
jgi:AbrB family looped-hinge helix DNA binding protein